MPNVVSARDVRYAVFDSALRRVETRQRCISMTEFVGQANIVAAPAAMAFVGASVPDVLQGTLPLPVMASSEGRPAESGGLRVGLEPNRAGQLTTP